MSGSPLRLPLLLSIAAALLTLVLKSAAYWLTGSVGLLSDAAESVVNLVAALTAYLSILYASRPVDRTHPYGHEKIQYFSSGLEGGLILVAGAGIAWYAVRRLLRPEPLEELSLGMALGLVAALLNGGVAILLLRVGRAHRSIALEADGQHLLSDVWTSVGVLAGLVLVALTGLEWLDPLIALVVAISLLWTACDLLRRSVDGLMDRALPPEDLDAVRAVIEARLGPHMAFHALRTRQAATRRFLDFHLLLPGSFSVRRAHALATEIEQALQARLPGLEVTIHFEPIEEPASWQDSDLLPLEPPGGASQPSPGRQQ